MKRYFYKYMFMVVLSFTLFTSTVFSYTKSDVSIKYNKLLQPIKADIINKDGHIFISARDISKTINAEIKWDEVFRTLTIKLNNNELIIYADSNQALFNKNKIEMPVGLEIVNGVSYVPLRFICETFGYDVEWNGKSKEINIFNDYGNYILLDENENENSDNSITLDQAIKKAKSNNSNLKNLEDAYSYMKNVRDNIGENLQKQDPNDLGSNAFPTTGQGTGSSLNQNSLAYLENSLSILRTIKSTDNQIKNQEINKQIINDTIEFSLITSITAIKNIELNINILEKNIEIGEMNIQNLEAKNKYGMISDKVLITAKNSQENLQSELETLKSTLNNQKENLKKLLATENDVDINVQLDVDYKELEKIDLEQHINKAISNDLSIQMIENEVSVAQYNYDTNIIGTSNDRIKVQNELNSAQRKLSDAKVNLEKKLRDSYANLQKNSDKNKNLENSLETAIKEYNIAVVKYKHGENILYDVEKSKAAILNAEKDIEENKLNFYTTLYTFYKPYLL